MKEKEILKRFRDSLIKKRDEYKLKLHEYGSDSYYDYCRGKKDLIEDIVAYLANELNE